MLPLPSVMQSNCLSSGAFESSKLFFAKSGRYGKRVTRDCLDQNPKFIDVSVGKIRSKHHEPKALATSDVSVVQTAERVSTYRFRTETGGQLVVLVKKNKNKYKVYVELISSNLREEEGEGLVLSWGIFRSDSKSFIQFGEFQESSADDNKYNALFETPFCKDSGGKLSVELDFDATLAPFYVSSLLNSQLGTIRSHRKTNFVVPVGFRSGRPSPLGVSFLDDGTINFAFFSGNDNVVLCLYSDTKFDEPDLEIDLDPYVNRTGDIWHALIENSSPFVGYGYRFPNKGKHVRLDPYAKIIQELGSGKFYGKLRKEPAFDWRGEIRPNLPTEKLIIYRLNITRFTKDKSSGLPGDIAGTFSGVSEKLHHFKSLGVNAVLLEPVFSFDEHKGPYFPYHFFSPGSVYGPNSTMKEMVKKLHNNGIEVLLEVVFIDRVDGLNGNFQIFQQMILESLRHWVIEFHIDGFFFVNASSPTIGSHGEFLSRPSLVEAIAFDPLLSKTKIIADSWDPKDTETNEIVFFPHWKRWGEVNVKFCVDARNFLRGDGGAISDMATRLCGSGDIFLNGRGPAFSFNYITRNAGLTLVDLVSFNSSELSWNCGEEGPTNKIAVLVTRLKQIRNFLFILFVSLGVPILNMGDEWGQSCGGSTAYADRKVMDWNALKSRFGVQITNFISFLSSLKSRRNDLLQRRNFLTEDRIKWHGAELSPPNWDDPSCKFLAMTLKADGSGDLFVAFNSGDCSKKVTLPPLSVDEEAIWVCLVDTALPFPGFFSDEGVPLEAGTMGYEMKSHSCVLFEARRSS